MTAVTNGKNKSVNPGNSFTARFLMVHAAASSTQTACGISFDPDVWLTTERVVTCARCKRKLGT
jgi:hypothetical protein